jgi:hypothetical protein
VAEAVAGSAGSEPERLRSGALIDAARRSPSTCLYCADAPRTKEHPLTEAIGGRLWARILCARHNADVNTRADEGFNKNFAPLVTMLQVRRQRGTVGAEFIARDDDGKPVTIVPEGFAKQKALEVLRKDERGRILHAVGDLAHLDRLPADALSPEGLNVVIATVSNPPARFGVGVDETLSGAVLKIALHFYAGFVGDVPIERASALLPYIVGDAVAGGTYVRTPFLHEDVFPDSWPARHEITCYPDGDHVLVTILLFSAYAFTCRLPFTMVGASGIRYTQDLSESDPRFEIDLPRPAELDWEDRPGLHDAEAYYAPIKIRLSRIHDTGTEQAIRARCERAAKNANAMSSNYGHIWDRYAAQLALECFTAAEVERIVQIGIRLEREGKNPWDIPVSVEGAG